MRKQALLMAGKRAQVEGAAAELGSALGGSSPGLSMEAVIQMRSYGRFDPAN